jgi:predicted PurR-regulated permease PerM
VRGYVLFTIAVLIAVFIFWRLLRVVEILYISALFAVVLMPLVERIRRIRIRGWAPSRTIAIFGLLIAGIAGLALFLIIALPPVLHDARDFAVDLPQRLPGALAKLKHVPLADKFGIDNLAQRAENMAASTASYIVSSVPGWLSHILDVMTGFVLCIYFMLDGDRAYSYFLSFFRPRVRARLDRTLLIAGQRMSKWLIGQGALMLILGVTATIVFGVLHVRYFVLLGVLMGLFNLVPVAGGVITILLAAGVAALDSWTKMAGVLIFYAIYVQIENGFLTPRIMKTSVDLMGLTVLTALLIGTGLAGIGGALVSVPTAALVTVLLDEYAVRKDPEAQRLAAIKVPDGKAPDDNIR